MPFLIVIVGAVGIAATYWSRSGGRDTPTVQERLAWMSLAAAALVCLYLYRRWAAT
jgi:hypothetical protein